MTRETAQACAERLNISRAAAELFHTCDVIDLHVDSYIWSRVFGYRLDRRHDPSWYGARFCGQVDIPRLKQVGVQGATWVITTNPLRALDAQQRTLEDNVSSLSELLTATGDVVLAETHADYVRGKQAGKHVAFLGVQGGSPLSGVRLSDLAFPARRLLRVTLLHLLSSNVGTTSAPALAGPGLKHNGEQLIHELNQHRVFVDLAHISEAGFFRALEVHSKDIPPIVTHTGVSGAYPHWRNLSDQQLKAIAERSGLVGIMYHTPFLGPGLARGSLDAIVAHLSHAAKVIGTDFLALGSDWDGAITTPQDMPTCLELPRLVHRLLQTGWSETDVAKVLGGNFLRLLKAVRP